MSDALLAAAERRLFPEGIDGKPPTLLDRIRALVAGEVVSVRKASQSLTDVLRALDCAQRLADATDGAAEAGQRQSIRQRMALRKLREALR